MWTCKLCHVDFSTESIEHHLYRNHVKPYFGPVAVFQCGHTGCSDTAASFEQMAGHCLRVGHDPCRISEGPSFRQYFSSSTQGGLFSALQEIIIETKQGSSSSSTADSSHYHYHRSSSNQSHPRKEADLSKEKFAHDSDDDINNGENMTEPFDHHSVSRKRQEETIQFLQSSKENGDGLLSESTASIPRKFPDWMTNNNNNNNNKDQSWSELSLLEDGDYKLLGEDDTSTMDLSKYSLVSKKPDDDDKPDAFEDNEAGDTKNATPHSSSKLSPIGKNGAPDPGEKVFLDESANVSSASESIRRTETTPKLSGRPSKYPIGESFVCENGLRVYRCAFCPKISQSAAARRMHERGHTGERPFSCPECQQAFGEKGQLKIHARIHTGERPYSCTSCPMTFRHKSVKLCNVIKFHHNK